MSVAVRLLVAGTLLILFVTPAHAQEPPPKIGPLVVDLHGTFVRFPDLPALADSRGLQPGELPGPGLGLDIGLHLYLFRWKVVTVGIGGDLLASRSHQTPQMIAGQTMSLRPVTEKFLSAASQLSLNFGSGSGWSYISGGIGLAQWSIIPDGADPQEADIERLNTVNYGGGARWFIKKHLSFSFDVRVYAIGPGTPAFGFPGTPRTTLMVIGSGISMR